MRQSYTVGKHAWLSGVLLLVAGTGFAQLTVTNNMTFWVRADAGVQESGGLVTNWINQAPGGGNDAAQTIVSQQPTLVTNVINGLPVVRFGDLDLLRTSAPVQTNQVFTMFAVAPMGTNSLGANGFVGPFHNGNEANSTGYGFRRQAFGNYGLAYPNVAFVNFGPTNHMGFQIQTGMRDSSGLNYYFANAMQSGSAVASGNPIIPTHSSQVGGSDFGFFLGDVAEVIVYNTALSITDRQTVHEYLIGKYAIPEPGSAALLVLGGAMFLRRRTWRNG